MLCLLTINQESTPTRQHEKHGQEDDTGNQQAMIRLLAYEKRYNETGRSPYDMG
jgi:hypothetical protein